ncbi:appetite-regulating hormone [Hemicordylus capensis]|uniref:appetite-regulating hormone n=1 Tax=Hemicordylus capensis TaxID=884348 RepID=UPI00230415EE|nr:appetite-regulating hormone [Hemicordylus capensis]
MLIRTTVLGMLMICSFWIDTTTAGSSFLSPEQLKSQQRKAHAKPTPNPYRRDAEALLDTYGIEGNTSKIEMKFSVPFEISMKLSEKQYKDYGQILEKFLEDIFAEDSKEDQAKP